MKTYITVLGIAASILLVGDNRQMANSSTKDIKPPVAKIVPKQLVTHDHTRIDNYFWLRKRENPEVMKYLEAENEYADAILAHTTDFQEKLFQEIKGRIKETDISVPVKRDDYYYYSRDEEGKQYPIHCRKKGSLDAREEITIDVNALAEGQGFCSVGPLAVSYNQDILAFPIDTVGRRKYAIRFRNLTTGEFLKDEIPETTPDIAWANDNKTLFYAKQRPDTLRSYRIYRHELGTDPSQDALVYEEKDEEFSCNVSKTKSKRFIKISSKQTLSTECRYLDANNPAGEFKIFLPRAENHEYSIDHYQDYFYIRTNDNAKNFRLMKTPIDKTDKENWQEVIPHRDDVLFFDFELFKDYLAVNEQTNALTHIRIIPWSGEGEHDIDFGEPAYTANFSANPEFDTDRLRYQYASLTTPNSVFDYNMKTREKILLKQEEVLGGFKKENYITERHWAIAKDGVKVPISLVYHKGLKKDGNNPLLLYGYGSYGFSMSASFDSPRLTLLDRGFVYAIAHIRGGEEMGRKWYEDGKMLHKKNTFTDFIACAEYLIAEKFTNPEKLFALGGSAGGLLMGAVLNERPDLFKGVIANVPWVDVVTTMLDDSIPLTTSEYDEWGNPNIKEYYDYMLSYSPYDNVGAKNYPNLLVLTGLHDSQVQYWEPAKWVAKLRALKTDNNLLLFRTKMEAGHGGVSGRYNRFKETAFNYAFFLDLLGIDE